MDKRQMGNGMYQDILNFWFEEIDPSQWWSKDDEFDHDVRSRFSDIHARAVRCELFAWRETARGRLAEIIILDQFSRNMFRGAPEAFAQDAMALTLAQEAISRETDLQLSTVEKGFMYIPYMHSESLLIHETAEKIYRRYGVKSTLDYELKHKKIIERFGRFPHRNEILGRVSTAEEIAFLKQPGSRF